jgi:hypothetical protein
VDRGHALDRRIRQRFWEEEISWEGGRRGPYRQASPPPARRRPGAPDETFFVNLSGATNAIIADGQGAGTILDDEPRISISDVGKAEGKKGRTTLFTFTVTLSATYDQPVSNRSRVDGDKRTGRHRAAKIRPRYSGR